MTADQRKEHLTKTDVTEQIRLLATSIDFDALVLAGVLERRGRSWWCVLDPERLPEHAAQQVSRVRVSRGDLRLVQFISDRKRQQAASDYEQATGERLVT